MALVENDVVKMEWEKSGWLQTSSKGKKPSVFILASKDYENKDGKTISVLFAPTTAFIIASDYMSEDEDIWTAGDIISTIKQDSSILNDFPYGLDEYVPILVSGEDECRAETLEYLGLTAYKEDIEARVADIEPYGEEKEFNVGS